MKNNLKPDLQFNNINVDELSKMDWNSEIQIPLKYIHLLRWDKLPQSLKREMYERFMSMGSKSRPAYSKVTNIIQQQEIESKRKIDLLPLINFLKVFSVRDELLSNLKIPLTENEYSILHGTKKSNENSQESKIFSFLMEKLNKIYFYKNLSKEQYEQANNLYDYLVCNEINVDDNNLDLIDDNNLDLIIVLGARKMGIEYRMKKAEDILQKQKNAFLFLTGGYEYNNEDGGVPVSEAEIMLYYWKNILGQKVNSSIKIDINARNTEENIIHSILQIKKLYILRQRPINIALITSPFHMRRSILILQYWISSISHMINKIMSIPSMAIYDKNNWLGLCNENSNKIDFQGLKIYIGEYFKLIGGRVTGEF